MIGQRKGGFLLPVMLVTACATLGWLVLSLFLAPDTTIETTTAKPARVKDLEDLAAELKFSMPPIRNYSAILDRPIFAASRRGTSEVVTPTVVVTRELKLKLTGTSISDTEKYALFVPKDGGEAIQLREGEDYQGWNLARVKRDSAIFRRNGAEERLEMDFVEPPAPVSRKKRTRRTTALRDQQQPERASGQDEQRSRNDLRNRNLRTGDPEEEDDEENEENQ